MRYEGEWWGTKVRARRIRQGENKSEHMHTIGQDRHKHKRIKTGGRAAVVVSPDQSPLRKFYEHISVFSRLHFVSIVNGPLCGPRFFWLLNPCFAAIHDSLRALCLLWECCRLWRNIICGSVKGDPCNETKSMMHCCLDHQSPLSFTLASISMSPSPFSIHNNNNVSSPPSLRILLCYYSKKNPVVYLQHCLANLVSTQFAQFNWIFSRLITFFFISFFYRHISCVVLNSIDVLSPFCFSPFRYLLLPAVFSSLPSYFLLLS